MEAKLTPKLRFSEFENQWDSGKLSEVCETVMGNAFKSSDFEETGVQLIRMGNLYQGELQLDRTPVYLPEAYLNDYKKFEIKPRDLIMSMTGTIGKRDYGFVVQIPEFSDKLLLNQRVMKIESNDKSHNFFLLYLLKNEKLLNKLYSLPGGTKQANLSAGQFKGLNINYPSSPEQQKIADFLSSVDKKISLLKEKYALLTQYKKGVMQKLFKQEIRFKDENGVAFTNWQEMKLNELLFEHKKRNSDLKFDKEGVLSVSGDIGIVNQIEHLGRSYAGESVANYHVVHEGDIVYTKSPLKANPYGIIKSNQGKAGIVSTLYAVYSCNDTAYHKYLDYYFSIDDNVNRYLRPLVHKGAKNDMKINNQRVLIDPIWIPCVEEQRKIVSFLEVFDEKLALVKEQIELTQNFKKGLLQQMFV